MRHILPCLLLALGFGPFAGAAHAKPASIEGSWIGGGSVKLKSGQIETVRCRLSFSKSTGRTFEMSANCSTTNGTFRQSGRVVQLKANRYSGRFYSDQYSVSGNVVISVRGRRQSLNLKSPKASGTLSFSKR